MNFNPVIFSIPIFITLILIEIIYAFIKRPSYYKAADTISNINCGIGDQVIGMMAKVFTIGIYQYLYEHYRIYTFESNLLNSIVIFILVDFLYYWKHRMSHEINLLWLGHSIHHQSEEYNLSVALRQSWFDKFFSFPFYLPLAIIGFDTQSFVVAVGLNLLYQFWVHTEVIDRMGFLEYFMSTPSHHRVHHARNPEYIDKNHGGVFIIWDKFFGTFKKEIETPVYGVTQPINTWNAFYANFMPWLKIFNEVGKVNTFKDRLLVWVKPPGWRPDYLGGQMTVPIVDKKQYHKFSTTPPKIITYYLVQSFIVFLGVVAVFLTNYPKLGFEIQLSLSFLVFWYIINYGLLFENQKVGYLSEFFKLIGVILFSLFFLTDVIQLGFIIYAVVSIVLLAIMYSRISNSANE